MTLVAGIDSSTQSCKVLVCDADTGEVVREGRAGHPDGTEVDPAAWESAAQHAIDVAGGLDDVDAVAVGAQQHGMVCLDGAGQIVRPALLWNDVRSADAARTLVDELGGASAWAHAVGVVPLAAVTVAKLRWLADNESPNADRTAAVCLPHDWLTWRLRGETDIATLTTDRSDASGTGYFDAASGDYRVDLLELALRGRCPELPRVLGPSGRTESGARIFAAGLGDNAAAALGLGAEPGDVIVSIGTWPKACIQSHFVEHANVEAGLHRRCREAGRMRTCGRCEIAPLGSGKRPKHPQRPVHRGEAGFVILLADLAVVCDDRRAVDGGEAEFRHLHRVV
ncbi:Xylulose kinase [Mycobacterium simulans]|nr:Xylulose kinase [Mycobacterium simulans]